LRGKLAFHFSPDLTSNCNNILIKETKDTIASIEEIRSKIEKEEYNYSPEYGYKVKGDSLIINISVGKSAKDINISICKK